jgi:uncharacterized phage infection (PIP) family protein YhgE
MNLLGKIFVVLIFVMSILFMALALMVYSTHRNWREEITRTPAQTVGNQTVGWKHRYEQLTQQNQKLQDELSRVQKEAVAVRTATAEALAKLQTEYSMRVQELATAEKELTEKSEALATATATLKTQGENVNVATTQVQKLTQDIRDQIAKADDLYKKSLELRDKLSQADVQLPRLTELNDQLTERLAKARLLLAQTGMTLEDPIDRRPPPLEATVESVNAEGMVETAAGRDDGIRVGHQLNIVRNNDFLGRIRITNATADRAVGAVMPEYSRRQIRRGDTATTKLEALARQK